MQEHGLEGLRLLVVEDEYLIASDLLMALENAGARVFGPVSDVERAMEVVGESGIDLDAAILDINLGGELVYPAARILRERGMPFLFVTGYTFSSLPREFAAAPCLAKPVDETQLIALVSGLRNARPTP